MTDALYPRDAACRGLDPDIFLPREDGKVYPFEDTAKDLCAICEVRDGCLEDALKHPDLSIRAGLTPKERGVAARDRRKARYGVRDDNPFLKPHGTDARYMWHLRNEGKPVACEPCLRAHAETTAYQQARRGPRVRVK